MSQRFSPVNLKTSLILSGGAGIETGNAALLAWRANEVRILQRRSGRLRDQPLGHHHEHVFQSWVFLAETAYADFVLDELIKHFGDTLIVGL